MNYNHNIACTVSECRFNNSDNNHCTLKKIAVVTHTNIASSKECTDCASFVKA